MLDVNRKICGAAEGVFPSPEWANSNEAIW
jgi:hypothetical protein